MFIDTIILYFYGKILIIKQIFNKIHEENKD